MTDHEPTTDVACGEVELSQELRDALILLRDRSDNDDFHTLVGEVLAGRRSLVEASGTVAFSNVVFARIAQELAGLTEDEKRPLTGPSQPSGAPASSCGTPCAGCPGICAAPGNPPDRHG